MPRWRSRASPIPKGAEASWGRSRVALAASNGFAGGYSGSRRSLSVSVLAGTGTGMERDYDFAPRSSPPIWRDPPKIGRGAGEKRGQAAQPAQGPRPASCRSCMIRACRAA